MDFQSLHRRDLQALCKKNRIPANMTNVAMADALQALQNVEGIDEILEPSKFLSPKKADAAGSPETTLTSRRTSTRRARRTEERQASPLPRARRVSVKASDIMRLVSEGEEQDGKQEGEKETVETPAPAVRVNARKANKKGEEGEEAKETTDTPLASHARTTRRRATKKEEGGQEEAPTGVPPTPVTRGRKAVAAVECSQTTRKTRQSSRKPTTVETTARRTTRAMAAAKMGPLDQEEEGFDGKNNDFDDKSEGIQELIAYGEECKEEDAKECGEESIQEIVADQSKSESALIEAEEGSEQHQDQPNPLPGLSDSPIRGLVSDADADPDLVPSDTQPTARNEEEKSRGGHETNGQLDAEIDLIHKEETEKELDLLLTEQIPDETKELAPEPEITVATGSSSPLTQNLSPPPSLQISEAVGSPANTSALVGDLIGELLDSVVISLAKTSIHTGLLTATPEAEAPDSVGAVGAVERKNDAEKENVLANTSSVTTLQTSAVQLKAKEQNPQVKALDLKEMSLRKLRVMYKDMLVGANNNQVVEGKRLALAEIDENTARV